MHSEIDLQEIKAELKEIKQNVSKPKERDLGDWITQEEAMKLLRRGVTWLWQQRRAGNLKWTKIGGEVLYSYTSIMDYLDKQSR